MGVAISQTDPRPPSPPSLIYTNDDTPEGESREDNFMGLGRTTHDLLYRVAQRLSFPLDPPKGVWWLREYHRPRGRNMRSRKKNNSI